MPQLDPSSKERFAKTQSSVHGKYSGSVQMSSDAAGVADASELWLGGNKHDDAMNSSRENIVYLPPKSLEDRIIEAVLMLLIASGGIGVGWSHYGGLEQMFTEMPVLALIIIAGFLLAAKY